MDIEPGFGNVIFLNSLKSNSTMKFTVNQNGKIHIQLIFCRLSVETLAEADIVDSLNFVGLLLYFTPKMIMLLSML